MTRVDKIRGYAEHVEDICAQYLVAPTRHGLERVQELVHLIDGQLEAIRFESGEEARIALRAVANDTFDDFLSPAEDTAMDELEAQQIQRAHVEPVFAPMLPSMTSRGKK